MAYRVEEGFHKKGGQNADIPATGRPDPPRGSGIGPQRAAPASVAQVQAQARMAGRMIPVEVSVEIEASPELVRFLESDRESIPGATCGTCGVGFDRHPGMERLCQRVAEQQAVLRSMVDSGSHAGFLTGVLKGLKWRVGDDVAKLIDEALDTAERTYGRTQADTPRPGGGSDATRPGGGSDATA